MKILRILTDPKIVAKIETGATMGMPSIKAEIEDDTGVTGMIIMDPYRYRFIKAQTEIKELLGDSPKTDRILEILDSVRDDGYDEGYDVAYG